MTDNCQGAKFEILLDGKTQSCRDTMLTAMGAAKLIQLQPGCSEGLADSAADRIAHDHSSGDRISAAVTRCGSWLRGLNDV